MSPVSSCWNLFLQLQNANNGAFQDLAEELSFEDICQIFGFLTLASWALET